MDFKGTASFNINAQVNSVQKFLNLSAKNSKLDIFSGNFKRRLMMMFLCRISFLKWQYGFSVIATWNIYWLVEEFIFLIQFCWQLSKNKFKKCRLLFIFCNKYGELISMVLRKLMGRNWNFSFLKVVQISFL